MAITCLFCLEFDNSVLLDFSRTVKTDFQKMCTVQIIFTLRGVSSFLDVFPSVLVPQFIMLKSTTVIINADPTQREIGLASPALPTRIFECQYFDTHGVVPLVPIIRAFIKRNCTTSEFNRRQLQSLTTDVCGKYCCLIALYMDRGYTSNQFISLFDACNADSHWSGCSLPNSGPKCHVAAGVMLPQMPIKW